MSGPALPLARLGSVRLDRAEEGSWTFVAPEALIGFGFGLFVAPFFDTVLTAVDEDEVGSASGTLNAVQQLGGAVGAAGLGTLFFSVLPKQGFGVALEHTLFVIAGVLALSFLLPRRARLVSRVRSSLTPLWRRNAPAGRRHLPAYARYADKMPPRAATPRHPCRCPRTNDARH
jgi:MFS family permease